MSNKESNERERALRDFEDGGRSDGKGIFDRSFFGFDRSRSNLTGTIGMVAFLLVCVGALAFVLLQGDRKKGPKEPQIAESFETGAARRNRTPRIEPQPEPPPAPVVQPRDLLAEEAALLAEQRRRQQELIRMARLKSSIVVAGGAGPVSASVADQGGAGAAAGASAVGASGATQRVLVDPATGEYVISGQQTRPDEPNERFLQDKTGQKRKVVQAEALENLTHTIFQGKILQAVLETPISSDLPGMVRARLNGDIYGESGRVPLLPRGSTLIGQYSSQVRPGQIRVFVVWNRAIRPDGVDIMLDSPGADQLGRSGLTGDVDNHFLHIFGGSALLSLIGAGASTVGVNTADQPNSAAVYREAITQSMAQTSSRVLERYINIPPTIHVNQGERISIFVNRDLDFSSVYALDNTRAKPSFLLVR